MTAQEMETIIDKAGLYRTEIAALFKITRQTLRRWLLDMPPRNEYIYQRAVGICTLLRKGVEKGFFPLPPGTPSKERRRLTRERLKLLMNG